MIANRLCRRSIGIHLRVIRTESYSLMAVFERDVLRLTIVFSDCEEESLTIEVILSNQIPFLVILN